MPFDTITSESRGFKIALLTVNNLTKQIDESINESKLDLVGSDRLVNLDSYNIVRRDRNKWSLFLPAKYNNIF